MTSFGTQTVYGEVPPTVSDPELFAQWRAQVKKRVKKFRCRFGEALKLELTDGGLLMFTTATGAPNQQDFARAYLKDNL